MKIRILGWQATGLRCADSPIDLSVGGDRLCRVSLIQMPNGTGKTTALELLRGTLNGSVRSWSRERLSQFRDRDAMPEFGEFRLDLLVDEAPLTFNAKLNFRDGFATMTTSSSLIGGLVKGYEPPSIMRRFLSEKFVELFIFDGELAGKLLQASETRASDAIDTLCQLDLIEQIIDICNEKWTYETKAGGAKTESGLTQYRNRLKSLVERIKVVKAVLRKSQDSRDGLQAEIQEFDKRIEALYLQSQAASKEYAGIKEEMGRYESDVDSSKHNIMQRVRHPSSLSSLFPSCLFQLKENLDVLKLPDVTSRQFFTELAEADKCVCGRPLGEHERKVLLHEADQYLGDEISGIVNAIKQDIDLIYYSSENYAEELDRSISECKEKQSYLELLVTNMRALEKKLDESGKAELQEIQRKREEKIIVLRETKEVIEEITRDPDESDDNNEESPCLLWLERQQKAVSDEIARITKTVNLKERIDHIEDWLNQARSLARENVKKIINEDCNKRLDRILAASPLRIAMINNHIVLAGQDGASVGQTLAVGYTYLATLLHRGQHEFPLVVDSPAGPLDDIVRREVGSMVPELCGQFVAFMIKTEREDFLPALQIAAKNDISYITIYRNTLRTDVISLEGVSKGDIFGTPNYTLVQGRKFFEEFTLVEC